MQLKPYKSLFSEIFDFYTDEERYGIEATRETISSNNPEATKKTINYIINAYIKISRSEPGPKLERLLKHLENSFHGNYTQTAIVNKYLKEPRYLLDLFKKDLYGDNFNRSIYYKKLHYPKIK